MGQKDENDDDDDDDKRMGWKFECTLKMPPVNGGQDRTAAGEGALWKGCTYCVVKRRDHGLPPSPHDTWCLRGFFGGNNSEGMKQKTYFNHNNFMEFGVVILIFSLYSTPPSPPPPLRQYA